MSRYKTEEKHIRREEERNTGRGLRRAATVLIILIFLLAGAAAGLYFIPRMLPADTSFIRSVITPVGDPDTEAPELKAKAAVLYSLDLDRMIYEKNADKHIAPYSTTKLMTCWLALENLDPDQMVTASENACEYLEEGMLMELVPGEKIKALDLVYASMMMSANDGATALAEAVSGDVASFAKLMNKTAADWGCTNTHFVNSNGWDDKNHYTSARDLAIITRKALENDTLRQISMTKYYTVPATNKNDELLMENALLKTMNDMLMITGGKTGSWSASQCSIALEFKEKGLSGVIVLLDDGSMDRVKDVKKLAAFAHAAVPGFRVTAKGDVVCEAKVRHGEKYRIRLTADREGFAYPSSCNAGDITVKTNVYELEAPVRKGDKAGQFFVYANDRLVYKGYLLAAEDSVRSDLSSWLDRIISR